MRISSHSPEWWGRGALAIILSPLALTVSAFMALVGALAPREIEPPPEPEPAPKVPVPAPKAATPKPKPGPAVPRPTARPSSTSSSGSVMSSGNITAAAEAMRDYIGGFVPQNAADLTNFVGGLHEVFTALSESLASVSTTFSDDEPVAPAVVDHLEELRSMVSGLVDYAAEAGPIFAQAHEADLERLDNPRPNEQKMDISQQ